MPYYEYDHTYYDRPPPRPYNPPLSSISPYRIEDLYAALPGDIAWSTVCPPHADRDIPPFMDPGSSEREVPPAAENRRRREKKGLGQTQAERGGSGNRSRDVGDRGKQIDRTLTTTRSSPLGDNTEVATRFRERRLVEVRLLLSQIYAQLETACNVYKTLDDKFKKHSDAVKSFVSADTLHKIWADMLQSGMEQEEAQMERSADFHSVMTQIGLCLRHLQSAEKDRLPSVYDLYERNALIERQFKNVTRAVEEIVELAGRAHMDHLACGNFIWHLKRARKAANPESAMWKTLLGKLPAAEKAYDAPDDDNSD
ncbi:hypothetical protein LZ32DRAFT_611856 [Colletotrichum eremochloae]|nr:hypothetical protein LZ32DRAFT_611856 [Colletotrichum eremochloae]